MTNVAFPETAAPSTMPAGRGSIFHILGVALCVGLYSLLYMPLGNEWTAPLMEENNFQMELSEVEELAEEGRNLWRTVFVGLGLTGSVLLVLPGRSHFRPHGALALFMLLTLGWCTASIAWSDDFLTTARRLTVLYCITLAACGFAKHFSARHLCWLAFCHTCLVLLLSLAAEFAHGTFSPFDSGYRFAGTMHPNQQAIRMACLVLACIVLSVNYPKGRLLFIAVGIVAFGVMILTKSRTAMASFLLAAGSIWLLDASPRTKVLSTIAAITIFMIVATGVLLLGIDDSGTFSELLLMGRSDEGGDPTTFTGRIPLWQYAVKQVFQRPLQGYGFNSFWTNETLTEAHYELEWAFPDAHNAYVDTMLSIGIVGLTLTMLTVFAGMYRASLPSARQEDRAYAFIFGLCVFGLLNGFLESHMLQPFNFTPFLIGSAFFRLAFFTQPDAKPSDSSEAPETRTAGPRSLRSAAR